MRNEDYWRGPNGITGESLPYLDSIEAVPAVDIDSRSNALRSGQFDIIHTSNSDSIAQFLDDDSVETIASSLYGDTNYIMLNVAEGDTDPDGANADSPLLNVHCRRALAFATDNERLAEERGAGLVQVANGPFGPGQLGYLEDSGYPQYDPDAALEEFDQCLADLGTDSIEFTFNTTNDPFNVETNTLDDLDVDRGVRRRHQGERSRPSSRASTSAWRSSARSTPSAGATTAASIPPRRPTGGRARRRPRSGRWR